MSDYYVDLEDELPEYECSGCGYLHNEDEAFGMVHDGDSCPECNNLLSHSTELRNPNHDPNRFTGFSNRKVRL